MAVRLGVDDQIRSYPLARDAGIGLVNRELFRALPSQIGPKDDVVWYSNLESGSPNRRIRVQPTSWPTQLSSVRVLWQQMSLPFALTRDGVDVLLAMAFVSPLRTSVPSVVVIHDLYFLLDPETYRGGIRTKYLAWMTRRSCRKASRISCQSAATRKDLLKLFPELDETRVSSCHPGFDADAWQADLRSLSADRGDRKKPFVLFTGTVEPKKNVGFLVALFDDCEWLRQTLDLVVVGKPGWGGEAIEEKMGMRPWIRRLGYLDQRELLVLYRDASCLVFPSLCEGFGYPVVEAMASGLPVLASDRGSLPEVCGDAALVLPLDPHSWLEAIRAVVQNENETQALREAGLLRAREFTWDRYASHLWECARQVYDEDRP